MKLKSVLFVDDEEEQRELVKTILQGAGYRVKTAASVEEALRLTYSEFPDLIITDVMMPGQSGYSLCSKLRADSSTADIPILVLTVLDDEGTAIDAGATAFLSKPIEIEPLRKTVAEILRPTEGKAVLDQALEHVRAKNLGAARESFHEVIRLEPEEALAKWARYYLAQIEQLEGNTSAAVEIYRAILDRDAEFWRAHNRLGLIYEKTQDQALAVKHYRRSLALNANQPDVVERLRGLSG